MADLQPTDLFLVNRSDSTQTVPQADLMAKLEDSDLMLVNRSDQTYTITGLDLKDSIGSPLALAVVLSTYTPISESEITATAVANGGTPPYVFAYQWAKAGVDIAGATQAGYTPVTADVGSTLTCTVTATDDAGNNITVTSDPTAPVGQGVVAPVIDQVTLAEQNPNVAPRFTDQKFDANVICTAESSTPIVYGLKAKVAGDLVITPKTSEITDFTAGVNYTNMCTPVQGVDAAGLDIVFDGNTTDYINPAGPGQKIEFNLAGFPTGTIRLYLNVEDDSVAKINGTETVTNAAGWTEIANTELTKIELIQTSFSFAALYAIEIDGVVLANDQTILEFADDSGLTDFDPGDQIRQDDAVTTTINYTTSVQVKSAPAGGLDTKVQLNDGTEYSVGGDQTVTIASGSGTIENLYIRPKSGQNPHITQIIVDGVPLNNANYAGGLSPKNFTVYPADVPSDGSQLFDGDSNTHISAGSGVEIVWTPGDIPPYPSGVVSAVLPADNKILLATSTGGWSANTGNYGVGDVKTYLNSTLWLGLEPDGTVRRNLLSEEPAYTIYKTVGGLSAPLTLTFPSTFADGDEPDNDLPAGTTLTVYGKVGNDAGAFPPGQTKVGASVTPTVIPGPSNVEMYGLRFDNDRSPYLRRVESPPTSWTISVWVKNTLASGNAYLMSFGGSAGINVLNTGILQYWTGSGQVTLATPADSVNKVWTNYIVKYDGSNLTGYIDGAEGSTTTQSISGSEVVIGKNSDGNYLDGYLSDFYFVADAVDPSVFGTDFDGKWAPYDPAVAKSNIAAAGGFGTEGFHLMFDPSQDPGYDDSGNGNDFTATNFLVGYTAQVWSASSAADQLGFDGITTYQSGAIRLKGSGTDFEIVAAEQPFTDVTAVVIGTSDTVARVLLDDVLYSATYQSNIGMTVTSPSSSFSSIKISGSSSGIQLAYVRINGKLLIDSNLSDNVKDTPMLDYSVLASGANGNLEATTNGTSLTYLGKAGTLYYYEEDGESKTHEGGTTFSSSNGKTYNFGQQGFANQYNADQVWSNNLSGTVLGIEGMFDGNVTGTGATMNSSGVLTLSPAVTCTTVTGYMANGTVLTVDGQSTSAASPGGYKPYTIDLGSEQAITEIQISTGDIAGIAIDGKILVDAVNGSYTWSNFWAGDAVDPDNSFDGDLATKTEISGSNKTITWTPSTPVSAASGIRIRASKYAAGNDDNLMEVNGSPVGITGTSPAWYDVPGDTLTSIAMKDIGSNQGWIHAVEVDGLLLVDSDLAGIGGAVGNELRQTWTEWNNIVTLYADNPADVAKFEAIKADLDAYPDNVTSHRAGLISRLNAGSLTTADVAEITEDINSVS